MIERFSLQDFKEAFPEATEQGMSKGEYCFSIQLGFDAHVWIRTSIGSDGYAADTGEDSIRIALLSSNDKPLISKENAGIPLYTTRVLGWQERTRKIIDRLVSYRQQAGNCPKCNVALGIFRVKKEGKNNNRLFASCSNRSHQTFIWIDENKKHNPDFVYLDLVAQILGNEPDMVALASPSFEIPSASPSPSPSPEVSVAKTDIVFVGEDAELDNGILIEHSALNKEQKIVVATNGKGIRVLEAIPGSGKTRVLENEVAQMILSGVNPNKIGCFTFSNSSAEEMRVRIAKRIFADITPEEIEWFKNPFDADKGWIASNNTRKFICEWVCTIHALSFRLLKLNGIKKQVIADSLSYQADSIIKDSMKELLWDDNIKSVKSAISDAIHNFVPPYKCNEYFSNRYSISYKSIQNLSEIYKRYMNFCIKNNAIDFDMMEAQCLNLLRNDENFTKMCADKFEYIIIDEAQDTSMVQAEILWRIARVSKNVLWTGDLDQCVIDTTPILGYNKSMLAQDVSIDDTILCGSGGSKSTYGKVVNIHKNFVNSVVFTVKTKSGKSLTTTPEHIYFADYIREERTSMRYYTYLMFKEELGYRVGVTQSTRSLSKDKDIQGYIGRLNAEHADKLWILDTNDSQEDARFLEELYSVKYGIPTWVFYSRGGSYASYSDESIARLYSSIDTSIGAKKLLSDKNMSIYYPHHIPKCMNIKRRRNLIVTLFADTRGKNIYHHYAVSGSDNIDSELLKKSDIHTRFAKKSSGWRLEGLKSSFEEIYDIVKNVKNSIECNVLEKARLTGRSLKFTPASHVRKGMVVFVESANGVIEDTVVDVIKSSYSGYVYDFDVEDYHNFCAGGIFVHNSMYSFRGAVPEILRSVIEDWAIGNIVYRHSLSVNYRSTQSIVRKSAEFIKPNYIGIEKYMKKSQWRSDAPVGTEVGTIETNSFRELVQQVAQLIKQSDAPDDWFVLSRTRNECAALHTELIANGIPAINRCGGSLFGSPHIRKVLAYAQLGCNHNDARNNKDILCEIANVASVWFIAPITRRSHKEGCSNDKPWIDCGCPTIIREGQAGCHVRYYGAKSIEDAGNWDGVVRQQFERNKGGYPSMSSKGAKDLVRLVDLIAEKQDARECISFIIESSVANWLKGEDGGEGNEADLSENGKFEDFTTLIGMIEDGMTIEQFLTKVDDFSKKASESGSCVQLGTFHWSKGLENKYVVVNVTRCPIIAPVQKPDKLPSGKPASIEEERRLAYVGITRAQEVCFVVRSKEYNGMATDPCFFNEILSIGN